MSIFLVNRHTRSEEQSGRAELVRALVTGRHTMLTAALLVTGIANAAAAILVTALAIGIGYATAGAILVGLATGLTGIIFAGVAAVTVEINEFSRSATGMAGAILGATFLLRAVGDMAEAGGSTLSWASPFGWATQTAPYVHDRWTPLLLSVTLAAVTIAAIFVMQGRREFGASLVPPRRGTARAHPWLGRPLELATLLQRGGL